jgi:hypothetical protein
MVYFSRPKPKFLAVLGTLLGKSKNILAPNNIYIGKYVVIK